MNIAEELKKVDKEIAHYTALGNSRIKISHLKQRKALLEIMRHTSGYFGSPNAIVEKIAELAMEGLGE